MAYDLHFATSRAEAQASAPTLAADSAVHAALGNWWRGVTSNNGTTPDTSLMGRLLGYHDDAVIEAAELDELLRELRAGLAVRFDRFASMLADEVTEAQARGLTLYAFAD